MTAADRAAAHGHLTRSRIILICKDNGGYIGRLASFLKQQNHDVLFIDTTDSIPTLGFLSGKLRTVARHSVSAWRDVHAIKAFGPADVLLVVNPGQVLPGVLKAALSAARTSIAYLYDSLARSPITEKDLARFDRIYSFDHRDIAAHGFNPLYNFMYQPVRNTRDRTPCPNKAFVVMSGEDRLPLLEKIAARLEEAGYPLYYLRVQTKHAGPPGSKIVFTRERLSLDEVNQQIERAEILIDLIRPRQSGLSFRFFEAMQNGRKVITDNPSVLTYDFYDPQNILLIDAARPDIPLSFLTSPYRTPAPDILYKYSLEGWCATVFQPELARCLDAQERLA